MARIRPKLKQSCLEDMVRAVVACQADVAITDVDPKAEIVRDVGLDELDLVELHLAIEEVFGIQIPDGKAKALSTSAKMAAFLASNWNRRKLD